MSADPRSGPPLVCITLEVPYDNCGHAGGRYVAALFGALSAQGMPLAVLAPRTAANQRAIGRPGAPIDLSLLPRSRTRSLREMRFDRLIHRVDPGLPSLAMVRGIITDRHSRQSLRTAPVIDLQWDAAARLAPLIRLIAPRARIVSTLHDVQSQRFGRVTRSKTGLPKIKWLTHTWTAKIWERVVVCSSDVTVVFSEKDRALLPHRGKVSVIRPPLAPGRDIPHRTPQRECVLFVGLLSRPDNTIGIEWLLTEIWPRVLAKAPDARLRIVGSGASDELAERAARTPGVDLAGFVDDLGGEYEKATVCVVPLLTGAGLKFKTVEALLAGVPTVSTSVGAEGVGGIDLFEALTDDPHAFADGIIAALLAPESADARAAEASSRLRNAYGADEFQRSVHAVYAQAARQELMSIRPSSTCRANSGSRATTSSKVPAAATRPPER